MNASAAGCRRRAGLGVAAGFAAVIAGAAPAQNAQTLPGLDEFRLRPGPDARPTPAPTPAATPLPTPARLRAPVATPPRTAPSPQATPIPVATPSASAATPAPAVAPLPRAITPPPARAPAATATPAFPWAPVLAVLAAGLALAIAVVAMGRRRRAALADLASAAPAPAELVPERPMPVVAPVPQPVPAAPATPAPRPEMELGLHIHQAGTTDAGAAVDFEIALRNGGAVTARDIRLAVRLLAAGAGQEAQLAAILNARPDRPFTPPFALDPGADAAFRATVALARDKLTALDVGGRPAFVPILALIADYRWEGGQSGMGAAYLLGVERPGIARLAPFPLDRPPEMLAPIGIRQHGEVVLRR